AFEAEFVDHHLQEAALLARCFQHGDVEMRPGELEGKAGQPGAAADVEKAYLRRKEASLIEYGAESDRLDEMALLDELGVADSGEVEFVSGAGEAISEAVKEVRLRLVQCYAEAIRDCLNISWHEEDVSNDPYLTLA